MKTIYKQKKNINFSCANKSLYENNMMIYNTIFKKLASNCTSSNIADIGLPM